ncbi:unnamed protein product [Lampetra fluviatilis]
MNERGAVSYSNIIAPGSTASSTPASPPPSSRGARCALCLLLGALMDAAGVALLAAGSLVPPLAPFEDALLLSGASLLLASLAAWVAWFEGIAVAHVDDDDDDHHDDDDDEEEDESEGLCRRRGHYRVLARRLNAQRSSGRPLCDVSLRMGGHVAHAHRGLLAAVSPYFRAMFAGTAREVLLLSDFFSLPLLHSVAAEFLRARGLDASITGYSSIAWLATATDTANETDTCSAAFTDERSIS